MTRMTDYCDLACDQCSCWKPGIEAGTNDQRKILAMEGWTTRYADKSRHGSVRRLEDMCPQCNGADPDYWRKQ